MATPQNTKNTKLGQGNKTAEQNYTAIRYGNDHGSISFGHIHKDGATTSAVMLQGSDGRHHISLDRAGERVGSTQIVGPDRLSVKFGEGMVEGEDCMMIEAANGNINIIATNGKIRLQGTDIELIAVGEGGSKGNVQIIANESITLDSKKLAINAKASYSLVTPGKAEIIANSQMVIYSSLIRGVTDACAKKDSKVGGKRLVEKYNKA